MKSSSLKQPNVAHFILPAVPIYWNYRTGRTTLVLGREQLSLGFFYSRIHGMSDDVTITMENSQPAGTVPL